MAESKELTLVQRFSMIALNAQRSNMMTTVKKISLRAMAAAVILEVHLEGGIAAANGNIEDAPVPGKDNLHVDLAYRELIWQSVRSKARGRQLPLTWWLKRAASLPKRTLTRFERVMAKSLFDLGMLEEIPNLLGCDMFYESAGVSVKEYRCPIHEYTRITEEFRAEILEEGPISDDAVCLLWLLRESGCLPDLFSRNELDLVALRINELNANSSLAQTILPLQIYRGWELGVKHALRIKRSFIRTTVGTGLLFLFPLLDRSQAVFIETEAWFSDSKHRLEAVRKRLESQGHIFTVLKDGEIPMIKINNLVYEAVPHFVTVRIPIQGVRLLPKRPI
ncbi:GPP34 family phosphoprotein [Paenibacillus sp. p3-SID1389]|uniref:GPP34 family phosphoprotein n=1 Tax=Paenibacillus sp. p3-SID1389 TaxID=2916364 RepID=UPI0021A7C2FD|nr:GPP34 family phosphoprotein [Paenibacillus sp. p3-SID1389]MCT2196267.1 GPP34 family phosphoprotein [Paenibacillus sp. p3-SID1389]